MRHRFKVGQRVRLASSGVSRVAPGHYKILALLPEERGERQYRIQHVESSQLRVAWESEISSVDGD